MDLVKTLKKSENLKDAVWEFLVDPKNPILGQDKTTGYSLLHACIILTEDEILELVLTSLERYCLRYNKPQFKTQVLELKDLRQRSP